MSSVLSNVLSNILPCINDKKNQINPCNLSCYFQPINYDNENNINDSLAILNQQLIITIADISYYNPFLISCLRTSQFGLKAILHKQIVNSSSLDVTNYFYNVILTINNDCNSIILTASSNTIIDTTLDGGSVNVFFGLSFGSTKCVNNMNYTNLENCIVFTLCETNECSYLTIPNKQWFNITNYIYYNNSNSLTLNNENIIFDTLGYYYLNNIGCNNIQFEANLNIFNSLDYQNGNVTVFVSKKPRKGTADEVSERDGPYYTTFPLLVKINKINGILNIYIYLKNNFPVTIGLFGLNNDINNTNNPNFITGLCITSSQLINIYNTFYNFNN